jgi:putative two-component system response regulator
MSSATILIVDDQEPNRKLLSHLAEALGHISLEADNGLSALAQLRKQPVDLVLLDIMMPAMDGYQVLKRMKLDPQLRRIPVIMITAVDELERVVQTIEEGAEDYLIKPFNPALLRARIGACLDKKRLHDEEEWYRREIEAYNLRLERRVQDQVREVSAAQTATIFALSKLADSRDPETGAHLERMREYAKILIKQLRTLPQYEAVTSDSFVENLYAAAPLHDIGKVGIPDRILLKPGKLTEEEFEIMTVHTTIGAETLRAVHSEYPRNEFVRLGIEIAQSHHEKWNGSGYPQGLSGQNIPLSARVVALADVYDALTSRRCYKNAFTHKKSMEIIVGEHGKHFDPLMVEAFQATQAAFGAVRETLPDREKALVV